VQAVHHTFLQKHIPAAIINAGDGINEHPTQALLDAFSMQEKTGSLQGLKSGYHRRHSSQPRRP